MKKLVVLLVLAALVLLSSCATVRYERAPKHRDYPAKTRLRKGGYAHRDKVAKIKRYQARFH